MVKENRRLSARTLAPSILILLLSKLKYKDENKQTNKQINK